MQYSENLTGIKINVQAVDISLEEDVKDTIRKSISRLRRRYEKIEWVDVYLEDKSGKSTNPKQVSIRLGIPGNDAFASENGDNFYALLVNVEEKLRRQLEKKV